MNSRRHVCLRDSTSGYNSSAICRNFLNGRCRFGRNCRYLHIDQNNSDNRPTNARSSTYQPSKQIGIFQNNRRSNQSWPSSSFTLSPNAKPFVPRLSEAPKKVDVEESFCPYYTETGECPHEGKGNCPLIHCDYCEMCCRYCLNPLDEQQRKVHKRECLAEHEREMKRAFANQLTSEKICGICMENVWEQAQRFGILNKCKHCYCLRCIRAWRKAKGPMQKEATRSCPQCRTISDFVIPSDLWIEDDVEKEELIRSYRQNMKQKICKYMKNGNPDDCPFGNKCFYLHQLPDGQIIESGPPKRRRRSPRSYHNMSIEEFVSLVPNLNLIRIGVGDEASFGFLFDEFNEIFGDDRTVVYNIVLSDDEDPEFSDHDDFILDEPDEIIFYQDHNDGTD